MPSPAPSRPPARPPGFVPWLVVWLALASPGSPADLPKLTEAEVKAAYVFNFAKYVEWPAAAFGGTNAPFVIGVLGPDPVGESLRAVVAGKLINGRTFELRRAGPDAGLAGCHILFLPATERTRLADLAPLLRDKPVLTVSDADAFIQQGGVIGLVKRGGNIRLQISLDAANAAGLKVSSKLLTLAEQVKGRPAKSKD
ncbi:MAG: transmembrane protein [Limisphaerales bacterium]|nr:MAG: transmembrane protein [Limisphaerales bacterium]TXT46775.1 MAG: transmembrane protein [Limisphaerales bacterium]